MKIFISPDLKFFRKFSWESS